MIGCFRGLVVNGEILDIYSYISVHLSEIIKDCKPSCDPNPCHNDATCKEHWSSYECQCVNPWAHLGDLCETELLPDPNIREGLIGCFRGLVVNGEILDIYSYISVHLSEIIKDCKPSCDPNPCHNDATCKEHWSSYECQCVNPWAHLGDLCETDVNQEGLTFKTDEAFVKSVLLSSNATETQENLLLNVRTHQHRAILLYAHDHLNNFVQLHIENGDTVVFAFNSGDNIEVLRVQHKGLTRGESVQIAIIRGLEATTLHVEDGQSSTTAPFKLLTKYLNKPWRNPEFESLAPQRPPVPPSEYFAINLGGIDVEDFKTQANPLPGFVGCLRGLRVADKFLMSLLPNPMISEGVSEGCNMKCDERPCHNQGICTEDFLNSESTCNCTHTSYFGPNCAEEKGASFNGDSYLLRNLNFQVDNVMMQLAFSTKEVPSKDYKSILLFIDKDPDYLMVALNSNGVLEIEESLKDGSWKANLTDSVSFSNGARHSVLYQRPEVGNARLWIDRKPVEIVYIENDYILGNNESSSEEIMASVYVGGLRSMDMDARFKNYRNYNVQLATERQWKDKTWVEDPPSRIPYKAPPGLEPGPESESNTSAGENEGDERYGVATSDSHRGGPGDGSS
ncbi:hypothetical protein B566_EDAN012350 [Ephemera danica]|nr:hypothetical protein B566_EDAN012350 [Ephemera danica]